MKKLLTSVKTFVASVALAAVMGTVWGAQPLAYWDQSFAGADTDAGAAPTGGTDTDKAVCLANGHTVSDDGKSIVIGEGIQGAVARLGKAIPSDTGISVLLAYSHFEANADKPTVIAGAGYIEEGIVQALMGLDKKLFVRSYYNNASAYTLNSQPASFTPAKDEIGLLALTYGPTCNSGKMNLYAKVGADWISLGYYDLKYSAKKYVNAAMLGGFGTSPNVTPEQRAETHAPATGMVIHGVALFEGIVPQTELSNWVFPSMQDTKDLTWDEAGSGAWTSTKFGEKDYQKEDYHTVTFADSEGGATDPVTITLDGARSVERLTMAANARNFTLTGGSVATPVLQLNGVGTLTLASAIMGQVGTVQLNRGKLEFVDKDLDGVDFGTVVYNADCTLGLAGHSHLSTTNCAWFLRDMSSGAFRETTAIDVGEDATLDLAVTNGMAPLTLFGDIAGTGTVNVFANQTQETAFNAIAYNMVFKGFSGKLNFTAGAQGEGRAAKASTRIQIGTVIERGADLSSGRPEVCMKSLDGDGLMLFGGFGSPFNMRNLTGNASVSASTSGASARAFDIELTRDCEFSGKIMGDNVRRGVAVTVHAAEPGLAWTLSGASENASSPLTVTNGAKVVIAPTGAWASSVLVGANAQFEIRRDAGALQKTANLTVDGELSLVGQAGVPLVLGDTIAFGESATLKLSVPDDFFATRANRKVVHPFLRATTELVLPKGVTISKPAGTRIVETYNDEGKLVELGLEKCSGLMIFLM